MLFAMFARFRRDVQLFEAFGFSGPMVTDAQTGDHYLPVMVSFILFSFLYSPVEAVLGFLLNVVSRYVCCVRVL